MKNSIRKCIIIFLLISLMLSFVIVITANATGGTSSNFDTGKFESSVSTGIEKTVENTAGTIISIIRIVSVAIAIIILLVIAMKYMIASPGDRADIKKHAVAYVIGAFLMFSVGQIVAILIELSNETLSGD